MRRAVQLESARGRVGEPALALCHSRDPQNARPLSSQYSLYTPLPYCPPFVDRHTDSPRPRQCQQTLRQTRRPAPNRAQPALGSHHPDLHRPPRNGGQGGLSRRDCMGLHGGSASLAGGDERARTRGSRGDSRAWVVLKGSNRPSTSLAGPAPPANCMVIL